MIEYLLADRRRLFTPFVFFSSGIFYAVVSAVTAVILFPSQASVGHVLLATIAVAPVLFRAVSIGADVLDREPGAVIIVQSWLVSLYFSYMLGAVVGFQFAYLLFPEPHRSLLLQEQMEELEIIEGVKVNITGMASKEAAFWFILENNLRVYLIAIILSLLYGTGGVLLLNWNASIIAALFFSKFSQETVSEAVASLVSIIPHGFFEFLGYFTGGITGILMGVAIIQEGWNTRLLRVVLILFVMGVLFVVFGAFIEAGYL